MLKNRKNSNSKLRISKIKWIDRNIDNVDIPCRKLILNKMAQTIGVDRFFEEGTGSRISFNDLEDYVLEMIKELIIEGMEDTKIII